MHGKKRGRKREKSSQISKQSFASRSRRRLLRLGQNRGQIWVETVIYTLIAIILIGLVLAFINPKIGEIQDRVIIEQTIELMNNLENIIFSIGSVAGNKRIVNIGIKKGILKIDSENDRIIFEIKSEYEFSQPGEDITIGNIIARTEKSGSLNIITLTRNYDQYDLTYNGKKELKEISQSATPYKLSIENKGVNEKILIDITIS